MVNPIKGNPIRINSVTRPVKFINGTTERFALSAEVVFEEGVTNGVVVNLAGRSRKIRVGDKEFFLYPCKHRQRVALPDDENTWPELNQGVVFLVPFPVTEEIRARREDFREMSTGASILDIEF